MEDWKAVTWMSAMTPLSAMGILRVSILDAGTPVKIWEVAEYWRSSRQYCSSKGKCNSRYSTFGVAQFRLDVLVLLFPFVEVGREFLDKNTILILIEHERLVLRADIP